MIKQIVDFSRDERGAAIIEVFVLADNPKEHIDTIKALIEDGAIIQGADSDTIRATYKGSNQDKLLSLIDEGWSFDGSKEEDNTAEAITKELESVGFSVISAGNGQ